ncbi:HNH endonuclease [Myxococcota bacterium]|nr:HNH endonuclease [Myxococcota bacterium]MBU1382148.1 HNH endonuclease [Myxococcota bacterium]MBU1495917.1 HNH endonuclease [Myxococcota bacterium]
MVRHYNTDINGHDFKISVIEKVWNKGLEVDGYIPDLWRTDICGNLINFKEYGNASTQFGWEIDHIKPVSKGGTDDISNLQPLQWHTNRKKSDTWPWLYS